MHLIQTTVQIPESKEVQFLQSLYEQRTSEQLKPSLTLTRATAIVQPKVGLLRERAAGPVQFELMQQCEVFSIMLWLERKHVIRFKYIQKQNNLVLIIKAIRLDKTGH